MTRLRSSISALAIAAMLMASAGPISPCRGHRDHGCCAGVSAVSSDCCAMQAVLDRTASAAPAPIAALGARIVVVRGGLEPCASLQTVSSPAPPGSVRGSSMVLRL